jgi:predicted component of type VI protein secretion system
MTSLHVISDTLRGNTFDLSADRITIGRAADNTICLEHISVSKHHATLTIEGSDFKLCDLHSTNGTIVNGDGIVCTHLKDGDRITLGDVELRFTLAEEKSRALPPPLIAPAPSKPKPNGDSHESNNDSAKRPPTLARVKGFAAKSSQMFSRLRGPRRTSQTYSPPDENRNRPPSPSVASTTNAENIPIVIRSSVIEPPALEGPVPAAPFGPPLGEAEKEQALILKPPAPSGPIEIKKPLPPPQKAPLPANQPAAPPKPVLPTDQSRRPAPQKMAGASFYVGMTSVGLLLLIVGYTAESNTLKSVGLLVLITGFLSLLVFLRNGSIIAPPKRRP